ncbi:hypothetical protein ACOMHN_040601 [Nucella lapillus]
MRSDRRGLASFPHLPPQTSTSSPGQTCPGDAGPRNTRVQPAIGITESAQQGLEKSRAMLDQMQQPQCDLLVSIRERDEHVRQMRGHIHSLQQELRRERGSGWQGMAMMKRAVTALTARQRGQLQQPDGMEGEGEGGGEAGVRTQSVVRSTPSLSPSTLTRRTAPPGPYQPQDNSACSC